jgi:hypothetical protein
MKIPKKFRKIVVEACARASHEAHRAYCIAIEDHSIVAWEQAPIWQKESSIEGVEAVLFHGVNTLKKTHEVWLKRKRAEGWTYGPVKDPVKQEHPSFVAFKDLTIAQRAKGILFIKIVEEVANATLAALLDGKRL